MMDREQLRAFALRAQAMMDGGAPEDSLRHFLSSRLSSIFPDSPWWIQAHMEGTEAHVRFSAGERSRRGFADALVGKTAIEYEKNLTRRAIFDEGYHQVREYCAALRSRGIEQEEILGVLSDTVRWYGYTVQVTGGPGADGLYAPEHIALREAAFVDLSDGTEESLDRFELLVQQFLGRAQSRLLSAKTLVWDFGLESRFYQENLPVFQALTARAMAERPDYAALMQQVWQHFVACLGGTDYGPFSLETYVNEFYLVTVAKIICVNILAGEPLLSGPEEIRDILSGAYFTRQNLFNLVDYDYFGWLNHDPYGGELVEFVAGMQRRLTAYDFSHISDQDIFGQLLSQLANREHRLMLGQEFTPHWIARAMARRTLARLGENTPRMLDMCCGSGVFLIEAVQAIRRQYDISPQSWTPEKDALIFSSVMGFDIDPLAVMLAKVNWVIAMRDLFPRHHGAITVPVYHADSLFVATPITRRETEGGVSYVLRVDGQEVALPAFLFTPACRRTLDAFLSRAYPVALARAGEPEGPLEDALLDRFTRAVLQESGDVLPNPQRAQLKEAARRLLQTLEHLERAGRHGIWHFILSNSYKPGLTGGQFNCILSNPPWMAMSKLANNPYKLALQGLAERYGIKPAGPSHPHMELAAIFLLSAVDRYLKEGGQWSAVLPGSLLSGMNHAPLREEAYRTSAAALDMPFRELWELPATAFKTKAIVLSGAKGPAATPEALTGRTYTGEDEYLPCSYTLSRQGGRSAWTSQTGGGPEGQSGPHFPFTQGCDLFPRTSLFHRCTPRPDGDWDLSPITKTGPLWYLVSDSKKKGCGGLSATGFSQEFVFDAYLSKHLSPFYLAEPAKVILPGRKEDGRWLVLTPTDRALMNASTAYVFAQLEQAQGQSLAAYLKDTINIYGKLMKQDFSAGDWLVLSSASGSNPCAACLPLAGRERTRLVVDQTLYWYAAASEDEAVYLAALLNSAALAQAIRAFQPEGGFGERHIHTIPYRLLPPYDPDAPAHRRLLQHARTLMEQWSQLCASGKFAALLQPNSGALHSRRRRQQEAIRALPAYGDYEAACGQVLQP